MIVAKNLFTQNIKGVPMGCIVDSLLNLLLGLWIAFLTEQLQSKSSAQKLLHCELAVTTKKGLN